MPLPNEIHELFDAIVATPEDEEAFRAGYTLSLNPNNGAQLRGPVVTGNGDGIRIDLKMYDQSGTWVADPELPRHGNHVVVTNPAFVLGGLAAAMGLKHDKAQVEFPDLDK